MRFLSAALLGCALLSLALAGCSGGGVETPDLVPVSGTVTLDDKPLAGVSVMFGGVAHGITDESGRYELTYKGEAKGVPVGEHQVVCEKWVMPDGSDFKDPELSPLEAGAVQKIPAWYNETTELRLTVPPGGGTIDIPLKSEPPAGYRKQP